MLDNRLPPFENMYLRDGCGSGSIHARQYNTALNRFRYFLSAGKIFRLKAKFLHQNQDLYDLNVLKPHLHVRGSSYSGIKVVPIHSIIGSEGRTTDFDLNFHPFKEEMQERWVNLAIVHVSRLPLPPVQLIQVGEAYFVRDGHHRISVSRAFGQAAMDAEVITWNAAPPFPWQPETCAAAGKTLLAQGS